MVEPILFEIASTKARKKVNSVRNIRILTERDENPSRQKKKKEKILAEIRPGFLIECILLEKPSTKAQQRLIRPGSWSNRIPGRNLYKKKRKRKKEKGKRGKKKKEKFLENYRKIRINPRN